MSNILKQAIASLTDYGTKLLMLGVDKDRSSLFQVREIDTVVGKQPSPELIADLSTALFQNDVFLDILTSPSVTWVMLDVKSAQFDYAMGDRRISVNALNDRPPADVTNPIVHLEPQELFFLLFKRYPMLGKAFSDTDAAMVALIDVSSGHVCTYTKAEFKHLYQWSLDALFNKNKDWGVEPVTHPQSGALFKRVAPKLTLHRMQAIASHQLSVITLSRGNLGFLHTGIDAKPRPEIINWIHELNKDDTDFLIKAIYDRPFTAGVINQRVPRPDAAACKVHPLHARGERRVLMDGGHAPIAVTIDRTYM